MSLKCHLNLLSREHLFTDLVTIKHTNQFKVFRQAILRTKDTEGLATYLHCTNYAWKYSRSFPPTDILENDA